MAYQELIKRFDRIRDYMREFYVYGFKSREEYDRKSARSYDDERRRVESWLGDHMGFRQTPEGKNVFLSIDSRRSHHNPLYKAWKARSFTDGDITLHFILLDILYAPEIAMSLGEITGAIDKDYLACFESPRLFDESTVRKKLKEYVSEGLLVTRREGKNVLYSRAPEDCSVCPEVLDFFSEVSPCGVVGSFLLDREKEHTSRISFKHHYITQALDSEILCALFGAMEEKREADIENLGRHSGTPQTSRVVPLRIFISVQSGRQYLLAYHRPTRRMKSFRLDYIQGVTPREIAADFDSLRALLERMRAHMWGVSPQGSGGRTERVSFTVHLEEDEEFIFRRLEREKRCGLVERLDAHTCRFTAEVYDANELVPWIRTFLGRITELHFSNLSLERQFQGDLLTMYRLYGVEEET